MNPPHVAGSKTPERRKIAPFFQRNFLKHKFWNCNKKIDVCYTPDPQEEPWAEATPLPNPLRGCEVVSLRLKGWTVTLHTVNDDTTLAAADVLSST